jgi:hypothetical protein
MDSAEKRRLNGFANSKKISEQWMSVVGQMRNPLKEGLRGSERNIPFSTFIRKLNSPSQIEGAYAPIENIFPQYPNTAKDKMLVINGQYYLDRNSKDQLVRSPD